jgi:hypothetical protein
MPDTGSHDDETIAAELAAHPVLTDIRPSTATTTEAPRVCSTDGAPATWRYSCAVASGRR